MARVDVSRYQTFGQITERLDDIVGQVRAKDVSLERSLDLFDEAIALGSKAVSLVDATDFSPEERERLAESAQADAEKGAAATADEAAAADDAAPADAAPEKGVATTEAPTDGDR